MFSFLKRYSLAVNISFSLALALLCAFCYLILILLFLTPHVFHLRSLVVVTGGSFKPTVAVGLLSTALGGATSALVTRCTEHSLWLQLAGQTRSHLTAKESRRMAQWSVSPLARLTYLFNGSSWHLQFAGVTLFAAAILNPVLLAGITPRLSETASTQVSARTLTNFAGYLDIGNTAYHGGQFHDNLMIVAALAQMSNVSAPSSNLCTTSTCSLTARAAAIQASCKAYQIDNPNKVGTQSTLGPEVSQSVCSNIRPSVCVTLLKSDPNVFVNFTTAYPADCGANCAGDWGVLFGAYVNDNRQNVSTAVPINAVDCTLSYGNITVTQVGAGTPSLSRSSFAKSPYLISTYGGGASQWHRIWGDEGYESPYTLSARNAGASTSTMYLNPMTSLLLNYAVGETPDAVARRIERNFDHATLFAFARRPQAASVTTSTLSDVPYWHYNAKFLLILLVPFLAKLLVVLPYWRVGDDDTVIGYDPVEIASRGPIDVDGSYDSVAVEVK